MARPSTSAPTSGRSAACSSRCCRVAGRLAATRFPTRSSAFSSASPIGPRCPPRHPPPFAPCSSDACERIRAKRLHDIADALIELDDGTSRIASIKSAADAAPGMSAPRSRTARLDRCRCPRSGVGWNDAAEQSGCAAGGTPSSSSFQFSLPRARVSRDRRVEFAVSPDGRHVAFVATSKAGSSLWIRSLAAVESTAASWHGRRAQSILEPGQPVDRFLCGQSVENGTGERWTAGRFLPLVRSPWPARPQLAPAGLGTATTSSSFGPVEDGNLFQINVKKGGTPTPVTTGRQPTYIGGRRFPRTVNISCTLPSHSRDGIRAAGGIADDGGHGVIGTLRIAGRLRRRTRVLHTRRELDGAVLQ